jgi:putative transposase
MREHLDPKLVTNALQMAVGRRQPAQGLLHHSARGSQYARHAYRGLLSKHGMACSRSRKGDGVDNAVAERFFGSLQREWTGDRFYATRQAARDDVIEYIERFYNSRRKHSSLGYVSPNAYEKIAQAA